MSDKISLNVKLPPKLFNELEEYRKEMGMSRGSAVSMMIKTYINQDKAMNILNKIDEYEKLNKIIDE